MMRLFAVAGLVGVAFTVAAQEPAPIVRQQAGQIPTAPTITVESRLVSVAMNVTDATGAPVSGFKADDFELLEDGKPVKISVFEAESSTPLEIVIAVDASESTYAEKSLEREAMRKFVKSLVREQDGVALMSFADDVTEVVPFTNDAKKIDSGFGRIERGEATAMYDAIYLASQRLAATAHDKGQRRVIVLITDGEDTSHHGSYTQAIEEAERAGAMVYSLIVVPVEADAGRNVGGEHALIQMARDTGGKYYELVDRKDISAALEHVSDDLRTQYTVGYYAPHKVLGDAGLRHIEIRFKDPALREKYRLRYRTAYYVK
jgi:Ca-activated chloride channel family protein